MERIKLLTDAERLSLPLIISRRNIAREIIKKSISNFSSTFSNCIMIQGKRVTFENMTPDLLDVAKALNPDDKKLKKRG